MTISTVYYVTNPTTNTFQLALTPYGTPIDITTQGIGYHTFSSLDVDVTASAFSFPTHTYTFTAVTTLDSPVITGISPVTSDLIVGMNVIGTSIPSNAVIISVDASNQITLNVNATATLISTTIVVTDEYLQVGRLRAGTRRGDQKIAAKLEVERRQRRIGPGLVSLQADIGGKRFGFGVAQVELDTAEEALMVGEVGGTEFGEGLADEGSEIGGTERCGIFTLPAGAFVRPVVAGGGDQHQGDAAAILGDEALVGELQGAPFVCGSEAGFESHPFARRRVVIHDPPSDIVRIRMHRDATGEAENAFHRLAGVAQLTVQRRREGEPARRITGEPHHDGLAGM